MAISLLPLHRLRPNRYAYAAAGGTPTPTPPPSNAQPIGYDIMPGYGDSLWNGVVVTSNSGVGFTRDVADVDHARAHSWGGPDAPDLQKSTIIASTIPVYGQVGTALTDRVTTAEYLARAWPEICGSNNRRSLAVIYGRSGWQLDYLPDTDALRYSTNPASKYAEAISGMNAAYAAARAVYPGSRWAPFGLAAGTNDANGAGNLSTDGPKKAAIELRFRELIAGFRSDLTNGSEIQFVFYGPTWNGGLDPDRQALLAIYDAIIADTPGVSKFDMSPYSSPDSNHPGTSAMKLIGPALASFMKALPEPQKLEPFTLGSVTGAAPGQTRRSTPAMVRGIGIGRTAVLSCSNGWRTAVAPASDPINFGAATNADKVVKWGDMIVSEIDASMIPGAQRSSELTLTGPVNTVKATFTLGTAAAGTDYISFRGWGGTEFIMTDDNGLSRSGGDGARQGAY